MRLPGTQQQNPTRQSAVLRRMSTGSRDPSHEILSRRRAQRRLLRIRQEGFMRKFALLAAAAGIAAAVMALPASAHRAHSSATRAKLEVRKGKLGRYIVNGKGLTL